MEMVNYHPSLPADACAIIFPLVKVGVQNTGWHKGPDLRNSKEGGNLPKESVGEMRLREGEEILSAKENLLQFAAS